MTLAIHITDGHGPSSEARHELLVKKLAYFPEVKMKCLPVELCDMKFFLCCMSWEFMSRYEHVSRYKLTYYRAMI